MSKMSKNNINTLKVLIYSLLWNAQTVSKIAEYKNSNVTR